MLVTILADRSHRPRRLAALGTFLIAAAFGVYLTAPLLTSPAAGYVNVRWREGITHEQREPLERALRLEHGRYMGGTTWKYLLTDTSSRNIERIVKHPSVIDTHEIDRSGFVLTAAAKRAAAARAAAALLGAVGLLCWLFVLGAGRLLPVAFQRSLDRWAAGSAGDSGGMTAAPEPVARLFQRGVPAVGPRGVAAFRIVFGALSLAFVASNSVSRAQLADLAGLQAAEGAYGVLVRWCAAHPAIVDWLDEWLLVSGLLFISGAVTRWSYLAFAAGTLLWASVFTLHRGVHSVAVLVMTLVCLIPSRWADAWSVDAAVAARRVPAAPPASTIAYGFTLWLPRLVLGVAFAAAAYAKLDGGLTWVLSGAPKFHFLTDSPRAVVDWGPELMNYPRLAVAFAAAAVSIEVLFVTAAFSRRGWYRALIAAAGAAMLLGFWLFQGVFWPSWWILLVSFLPFEWLDRATNEVDRRGSFSAAHAAVIVFVCAQQLVVSGLRIDARPAFSQYDMYSGTYAGLDQYQTTRDPSRDPTARLIANTATGRLPLHGCRVNEELVVLMNAAAGGSSQARAQLRLLVERCAPEVGGVRSLQLEGVRYVEDAARGRVVRQADAVLVGPVGF